MAVEAVSDDDVSVESRSKRWRSKLSGIVLLWKLLVMMTSQSSRGPSGGGRSC